MTRAAKVQVGLCTVAVPVPLPVSAPVAVLPLSPSLNSQLIVSPPRIAPVSHCILELSSLRPAPCAFVCCRPCRHLPISRRDQQGTTPLRLVSLFSKFPQGHLAPSSRLPKSSLGKGFYWKQTSTSHSCCSRVTLTSPATIGSLLIGVSGVSILAVHMM